MTDDNKKMPQWEAAFSEYAKESAPDLLSDILARIDASDQTKAVTPEPEISVNTPETVIPVNPAEPEIPANVPKRSGGSRFSPARIRRLCFACGSVAAVILAIFLVIRLPGLTKKSDSVEDHLSQDAAPTTSAIVTSPLNISPLGPTGALNYSFDSDSLKLGDITSAYRAKSVAPCDEFFPETDSWHSLNKEDSPVEESVTILCQLPENSIIGAPFRKDGETYYGIVVDGKTLSDTLLKGDNLTTGTAIDNYYLIYAGTLKVGFIEYIVCRLVN
ncbi:MAG: hypothetical protein IKX54_05965 [Lachnospiraceae bacterium]|nr:hypothetical protein [Lachnospiraceae bacterium]